MTRIHFLALVLGIAFIALSAVIRIADPPAARLAREILFDQYQRLKPREYQPLPVRILDIDEASLASVGQWPWPRTYLARVVARLNELGAASVAFDMVMPEADRMSASSIARRPDVRAAIGADVADALDSKLPDNDELFAQAIADRNVVLGFGILPGENGIRPPRKAGLAFTGIDPALAIVGFAAAIGNVPALDASAAGLGAISISPEDNQGIVRQVPLIWSDGQRVYPSLATGGAAGGPGRGDDPRSLDPAEPAAALSVRVGDYEIPTTRRGEFRVYFSEKPSATSPSPGFSRIRPMKACARSSRATSFFIGTSAVGLLDVRTTPLGDTVPGVSVHAQALEQVLTAPISCGPIGSIRWESLLIVVLGLYRGAHRDLQRAGPGLVSAG